MKNENCTKLSFFFQTYGSKSLGGGKIVLVIQKVQLNMMDIQRKWYVLDFTMQDII